MASRAKSPRLPIMAALVGLAVLLAGGQGIESAEPVKNSKTPRRQNRLAKESSPYLLQHARNPVDWYPWGAEAFARAKKEKKLVFLSIGYSSCHWCHVMERESFENEEVAKLLNESFICIKVDREERPDIDSVYMTALHVMREQGGWPLSMFLTAEGKPIFGGTYWPPEDREVQGSKIPGFKRILRFAQKLHTEKPEQLIRQADEVANAARRALSGAVPGIAVVDLNRKLVEDVVAELKESFDKEHGGFGSPRRGFRGPKFPTPCYLELLLREGIRSGTKDLLQMASLTLDRMAQGGIYDHLGGGFHRYSTERTWTVPHFEKMLYDNAQLVHAYANAYAATRNPDYARVIRETLEFVDRELTSPEGGFYSALDADSEGVEGQYYVWKESELNSILGPGQALELFKRAYGVGRGPNFEENLHIFLLPVSLAELAASTGVKTQDLEVKLTTSARKLLEARGRRPRPFLDTKVLTGWNGQMIAGYARAGQVLGESRYVQKGEKAAAFILARLRDPNGRLFRTYGSRPGEAAEARVPGYLDDYAYLVQGLLALHDATGNSKWLGEARALTANMVRLFHDSQLGGFFYTSKEHEELFARTKDQYDGAQPSGNSVAADNLVSLWVKTAETSYRDLAHKTFKAFAGSLKSQPMSSTAFAAALSRFLDASEKVTGQVAEAPLRPEQPGGIKKSDSVVAITAKASPEKPGDDGKQSISVELRIDDGWHIYANPVGQDDLAAAQTDVTISAGKKFKEVKIEYPEAKEKNDSVVGKYKVYEGKVTVKASVQRAQGDTGPLEVTVSFQACNDKQCLLPARKTIQLK